MSEGTSSLGGLKGKEKNLSALDVSLNNRLQCRLMLLAATKVAVCCGGAKQSSDPR